MDVMEMYSLETWILDRHADAIKGAEARSRLEGWPAQDRFAERLAAQLRRIADRLDGRQPTRIFIHPG